MRSKHWARLVGVASAAFAAAAMVVPAAQAATPAPGYEQFAGCPSHAEDPLIEVCLHSVITGGHFQMGSKDVPITNPIPLNGGTDGNLENFAANSKGGLTPVKQKVPGGVVGLTGLTWLLEVLGSEALTLYAVTEAVGLPHLSLSEIKLPIRVHLINGALGNNCYVGSPSNPINLNLTTGTTSPPLPNKPISGQEPTLSFNEASGILKASNGKYVDNSFAAPGASGCVLTVFGFIPISINGLVNSQSGLPSAAGKNATTQEITAEFAPSELVYP